MDTWSAYSDRAEQFERQRLACESGLAFAFAEGALVDAIRTGKWYGICSRCKIDVFPLIKFWIVVNL